MGGYVRWPEAADPAAETALREAIGSSPTVRADLHVALGELVDEPGPAEMAERVKPKLPADIDAALRSENVRIYLAEVNGEPQGMIVVVPNLNELIRDLDGHLLPFGWLRLLWRLRRPPSSASTS